MFLFQEAVFAFAAFSINSLCYCVCGVMSARASRGYFGNDCPASAGGARVEKASVAVLLSRIGSDGHRTRSPFLYYCISKGSPADIAERGRRNL
jgi:hypothetical protein